MKQRQQANASTYVTEHTNNKLYASNAIYTRDNE